MPEGPAVARRGVLERCSDLVDRPAVRPAAERTIGTDAGSPAAPGIDQARSCRNKAAFHEQPERDARLVALVGDRAHRAFVERQRRIDALAGDLHVCAFALDTDPAPAEPPSDCSGGAGAEEWVENDVA